VKVIKTFSLDVGEGKHLEEYPDVDRGAASHWFLSFACDSAYDIPFVRSWFDFVRHGNRKGLEAKLIQKLTIVIGLCCSRDTLTLCSCIFYVMVVYNSRIELIQIQSGVLGVAIDTCPSDR
jgi:hypothetical protein